MRLNLLFAVVSIGVTLINGASSGHADDLEKFEAELRAVAAKYESWSARLDIISYSIEGDRESLGSDPWSVPQNQSMERSAVRLVRSGEKFRRDFETMYSGAPVERQSWDGKIARVRAGRSTNSPMLEITVPRLPHSFILVGMVDCDTAIDWLFGFMDERGEYVSDYKRVSVSLTLLSGNECWKVELASDFGYRHTIWLSKRHDLLPVRVEVDARGGTDLFEIESFQQSELGGERKLWFPQRCLRTWEYGLGSVYVDAKTFRPLAHEADASVFSDIDVMLPAMLADQRAKMPPPTATIQAPMIGVTPVPQAPKKTPSIWSKIPAWFVAIVGSIILIPCLILLWLVLRQRRLGDGQKLSPWHKVRNVSFVVVALLTICLAAVLYAEPRFWPQIVPAVIVVAPLTWFLWRRAEATEKTTPEYRVRTIAGLCGGLLTLLAFGGLCAVPSWWQHGVAAALAGVVGLIWIALMQCFIRSRRFSIMTILSLATCFAMIMSGYQGSTQQIRSRQKMMDALGPAGYQVDSSIGYLEDWGTTPEGLLLHRKASDILGVATFQSVRNVRVPNAMFTEDNVRQWNWSDVWHITVTRSDEEEKSFVASADAIAALPISCPLTVFECQHGDIDEAGLQALSRITSLTHIGVDLGGNRVPDSLSASRGLLSVTLSDVTLDSRDIERLAGLKDLHEITLKELALAPDATSAKQFPKVRTMIVYDSVITPEVMSLIDKARCDEAYLVTCAISDQFATQTYELALDTIVIQGTHITDQQLQSLSSSKFKVVQLNGTRVTPKGMDQFSKNCPKAVVHLQ